ncbi:carbon-nitrogen hydrolase family protein, partial [Chloroflexota bacterium]
ATLEKMKANIIEAAAQGSNIIVFPEMALNGMDCSDDVSLEQRPCDMHMETGETVPGPSTQLVACLAKEYDVYVIFGMAERDELNPKILYNSVAIVAPEGIMGTYRKIHLGTLPWVTEGICFRPGTELPIWETKYGLIGIQICYDFWFNPELSRIQALKGAHLIINCSGSWLGPRDHMLRQTAARAAENLVYTATANLVGSQNGKCYYGHSVIAGPDFPRFSRIYIEAGDGEEIISTTCNFEKLQRWGGVFPWREWRRSKGRLTAASKLIAREFEALV